MDESFLNYVLLGPFPLSGIGRVSMARFGTSPEEACADTGP